MLVLKFSVLTS